MTKLAFTLFAGALVLNSILGWNVMTTVFISELAVALFTMIGGFTAVAYTDAIQVIIMIGGSCYHALYWSGQSQADGAALWKKCLI